MWALSLDSRGLARYYWTENWQLWPLAAFRGGNMLAVDPDSIIGRILNFIGQNLKVDKLFIDMGFDPNHFTWDAVFHRVAEIAWANVNAANKLGRASCRKRRV